MPKISLPVLSKKKRSKESAGLEEAAATPAASPDGSTPSPAERAVSVAPPVEEVAPRVEEVAPQAGEEASLRRYLSKNLDRDVSTPDEGFGKKVRRVAMNPYLVLGAATVGVGIATVLTAGTVHLVLGAVGAGQLTSNGSKAVDLWKSKRQGTVYLDRDAVDYLLSNQSPEWRLEVVRRALSAMPPGDAHLTRQDLIIASASLPSNRSLARTFAVLSSPHVRAGLALLSAGLFLIAVVVIPEYIRDPTLRAAAIISSIGVILIAASAMDALKNPRVRPAVGK
ncbi:MAG TPA: hypothetical protein VHZ03_17060 [Trebonia sp.]|jgi:hypothetical protein|nr:hypothetical protein [Trebonia sp.]